MWLLDLIRPARKTDARGPTPGGAAVEWDQAFRDIQDK
jgi:hypothetical protein